MTLSRKVLWTLDELSARVAAALAVGYDGQASGRVREVPDKRTIRYYTTLGLVDRPAATRGRTALYGSRHLLQLVAIKRLQAQGLSLAEVQARLLGQTDGALAKVARLPASEEWEVSQDVFSTGREEEGGARPREAFWRAEPAPVPEAARALVGVPLAAGVTLLLEGARPVDEHDLSALRSAAAPLLKLLRARRLVAGESSATRGGTPC